jgi:ATP-dependent RNA helicase RhlE
VARRNAESELVTQAVYFAEKADKRDLLIHLLVEEGVRQAIVFTRTKHGADRLAKLLVRDGVSAVPIHGDRSQGQRTRALADFKAGKARLLVATDIAARGLDIEQLPHVINYELPNVPEDYVHRIGRTGRAGSPGRALSLEAR